MFAEVGVMSAKDQDIGEALTDSFALMPAVPHNSLVIDAPKTEEQKLLLRNKIERLERALYETIANGAEEFDCEDDRYLTHRFVEGVYARELVIPGGTVVIGKLHKYPRICVISGGDCTFVTEKGTRRVQAPFTEVMQPGTKTAVYAHTDTTWTAIHGVQDTDLVTLEQILIAPDHEAYQRFLEQGV